jgi:hypothetical protein
MRRPVVFGSVVVVAIFALGFFAGNAVSVRAALAALTLVPETPTPVPLSINPNDAYVVSVVRPMVGVSDQIVQWLGGIANGTVATIPTTNSALALYKELQGQMTTILQAAQPASPPYQCLARLAAGTNLSDSLATAMVANGLTTTATQDAQQDFNYARTFWSVANGLEAVLARYLRELDAGRPLSTVVAPPLFNQNPNGPAFLSYHVPESGKLKHVA